MNEMISGMAEIKVNSAQHVKLGIWETTQNLLYQLEVKALQLFQYQILIVKGLSQIKTLAITSICAISVYRSEMTLGTMLSIGYIVGQLKGPLEQMVDFLWSGQDAKISFDRLHEIQRKPDECSAEQFILDETDEDIILDNVTFKYPGSSSPVVIEGLNLTIENSKVYAFVGTSGSGKTTLMKLLLKFYDPVGGAIYLGEKNLNSVNPDSWRKSCGVVLQDGLIFSGTVAQNIAIAEKEPDERRLREACQIACIESFIQSLPLGFQTRIGKSGVDISGGQRQRILIARAVYADPKFIFFDEATSALDANNEKQIMENLQKFFLGRTVIIIAHRLSTVKNADKIIVMHDRRIAELGSHHELTAQKGIYYELVKNQLELGN